MRKKLKHLYDRCSILLRPVFDLLVRLPVHLDIWATDQLFLMNLNNPVIGRISILGRIAVSCGYMKRAIERLWNEAREAYILQVFEKRNQSHYALGGRGYANLDHLTKKECEEYFSQMESRVELFAGSNPSHVAYQDGESFLDAGCGKGQNLKFIMSRYPSSPYAGFDIDERCLEVAKVGIEGKSHRSLRQGSLLDLEFLRSFRDKSVDHSFICHAFSTLLESTVEQTRESHQMIVDELVRISRKSVMIIDEMSADKTFEVIIEQLTRATIHENISSYFIKHQAIGEACILSHGDFRAVFFKSREQ